jgi:acyl-coenzyme A synthetase/AMP-(fatty) acid ligase
VHAAVVLRPGATTSTAELVAHCKERIAGYKAPRAITFLDALPRTGSGKVHKLALRATAGGSSASDATPPR